MRLLKWHNDTRWFHVADLVMNLAVTASTMGSRSVSTQVSTGHFAALDGTEGKLLPSVSKISIAELSGKGQLITLNKSLRLVVRIHL